MNEEGRNELAVLGFVQSAFGAPWEEGVRKLGVLQNYSFCRG